MTMASHGRIICTALALLAIATRAPAQEQFNSNTGSGGGPQSCDEAYSETEQQIVAAGIIIDANFKKQEIDCNGDPGCRRAAGEEYTAQQRDIAKQQVDAGAQHETCVAQAEGGNGGAPSAPAGAPQHPLQGYVSNQPAAPGGGNKSPLFYLNNALNDAMARIPGGSQGLQRAGQAASQVDKTINGGLNNASRAASQVDKTINGGLNDAARKMKAIRDAMAGDMVNKWTHPMSPQTAVTEVATAWAGNAAGVGLGAGAGTLLKGGVAGGVAKAATQAGKAAFKAAGEEAAVTAGAGSALRGAASATGGGANGGGPTGGGASGGGPIGGGPAGESGGPTGGGVASGGGASGGGGNLASNGATGQNGPPLKGKIGGGAGPNNEGISPTTGNGGPGQRVASNGGQPASEGGPPASESAPPDESGPGAGNKAQFPPAPNPISRGMSPEVDETLKAIAKKKKWLIFVRDSNPGGARWVGKPGYAAKPQALKAKSIPYDPAKPLEEQPYAGLVRADKLTDGEIKLGYKLDPGTGLVSQGGKHFYSDIDVHGVYDTAGNDVTRQFWAELTKPQYRTNALQDLIQHFPHDWWRFRNNPAVAGPNFGPQVGGGKTVTAYLPDSTVQLSTVQQMKALYTQNNINFSSLYPHH